VKASFELDGTIHSLVPLRRPGGIDVVLDGKQHAVEMRDLGSNERLLTLDGRAFRVFLARRGDTLYAHCAGRTFTLRRIDAESRAGAAGHAVDEVLAPMPGVVVRVDVAAGDTVSRGTSLLTIESMKLQTSIHAPRDGTIARIAVIEGSTFDKGSVLVALVPLAGTDTAGT
jgi:biotin carboxyl carrier protein